VGYKGEQGKREVTSLDAIKKRTRQNIDESDVNEPQKRAKYGHVTS
jgi:hypothetical protein